MIKPEFSTVFLNFSRYKKMHTVQAVHDRIIKPGKMAFLKQNRYQLFDKIPSRKFTL